MIARQKHNHQFWQIVIFLKLLELVDENAGAPGIRNIEFEARRVGAEIWLKRWHSRVAADDHASCATDKIPITIEKTRRIAVFSVVYPKRLVASKLTLIAKGFAVRERIVPKESGR